MKQSFYTYLHCKPDGTPFYVGKGFGMRCFNFIAGRSTHHKNICAKYGAENILVYVFPAKSEEEAFLDEMHQIAQLRREGFPIINLTDGGDGVSGLVHSDESRKRISAAKMGYPSPRKGVTLSKETREKISRSWEDRIVTPETRAKQSASLTGKKHADSFESRETKEVIESIVGDYISGATLPALEKKYRTGHRVLHRILVANGVTIRSSRFKPKSAADTS